MPTCNICLDEATSYNVPHRPSSCRCKYIVHKECYNKWLKESNMAYNCIICHEKVSVAHLRARNTQIVYMCFAVALLLLIACFAKPEFNIMLMSNIKTYIKSWFGSLILIAVIGNFPLYIKIPLLAALGFLLDIV